MVALSPRRIASFSARSQRTLWMRGVRTGVLSMPGVEFHRRSGTLLVEDARGLTAVAARNGAQLWSVHAENATVALHYVLDGDRIYAARGRELRILDISNGSTLSSRRFLRDIGRPARLGEFVLVPELGPRPNIWVESLAPGPERVRLTPNWPGPGSVWNGRFQGSDGASILLGGILGRSPTLKAAFGFRVLRKICGFLQPGLRPSTLPELRASTLLRPEQIEVVQITLLAVDPS
ncbi:MAG: PQQ-binding-like beta-propeller repeat protein, partial [Deltaproteobacteria bacterium]|nr:PQQ-binding-like beta-propeller repeat protein [Deltaproteobacteria bacterium]